MVKIVPDLYIAWHAGKSSWKNFKSLNQNSIGVEITNPGHEFGYKKFSKEQIFSLLKLSKFLIKKYKIRAVPSEVIQILHLREKKILEKNFPWEYLSKNNIGLWHTLKKQELIKNRKFKVSEKKKVLFFNNLFKIGYSKNIPTNINKDNYLRELVKTFQRRFRQELIKW